jgi:hypothetical protein
VIAAAASERANAAGQPALSARVLAYRQHAGIQADSRWHADARLLSSWRSPDERQLLVVVCGVGHGRHGDALSRRQRRFMPGVLG